MDTYVLHAQGRDVHGKKVRTLRAQNLVPAVIYGHGEAATSLSVARGELEKVYRKAGGSSVIKVDVEGKQQNAIISEIQADPVTGIFLHVDLHTVRMDEKIRAEVPLVFEGTSPAVRELDGILVTNITELEVEALPGDLPHEITVSVDSLETFDDVIAVSDIKVPPGVEVLTEVDSNVVLVQPPKTQEQLDAELAEEEQPSADDVELVDGEEPAEGEEGAEEGSEDGESKAKEDSDDSK